MNLIEEILKEITEKKDEALYLSKSFVDKSKRAKFRDFAAAYVDVIVMIEEMYEESKENDKP